MAEARRGFPSFRFVSSENLHITLEFLGNEVSRAMVPRITHVIQESVAHVAPFELCLGTPSAFPSRGRPRVLYVGTDKGTDRLVELASKVRSGLVTLGFEADKPFQPHITLARRRRDRHEGEGPDERALWEKAFSRLRQGSLCWCVSQVFLMESTLTPAGAVYSELGRIALPEGR